MIRWILFIIGMLFLAFVPLSWPRRKVKVGSKKFTESVILGEMLRILCDDAGVSAQHSWEIGGTKLVFEALRNGDIDVYPEYTGTIAQEILGNSTVDFAAMQTALQELGIQMSQPLGFNNTYALGMTRQHADALQIKTVSDLLRHPQLRFGFSNEFVDREDGWKNLQSHYELPHQEVTGLDHDLAYKQLELGAIDVIDVYTTDAKINSYNLAVLKDDLNYFPRYDAVLLYRDDLPDRSPQTVRSLLRLQGAISESEMIDANSRAETEADVSEPRVAADWLEARFGVVTEVKRETLLARLWQRTIEHLDLVRRSFLPAILLAVPLGIAAAKLPRLGQVILASVGIIQTIPALALLVLFMPVVAAFGLVGVGLGSSTAVAALLLYSLLPIVRNTHAGLVGISSHHREAALALGLPPTFRLLHIELPLASRSVLAGIKTAAVINVGFATLGALIGAGGYGQPILKGIRLNDLSLILQGAIPAAILALAVQAAFELAERWFVPKGLRLSQT